MLAFLLPQKNPCHKINVHLDTVEAILYHYATNEVLFSMINHLFCFPIKLEIKLFNSTDEDDILSPVITQEFFSPGNIFPLVYLGSLCQTKWTSQNSK